MKNALRWSLLGVVLVSSSVSAWADRNEIVEHPESVSFQRDGNTLWTFHHHPAEGKPYVHPLATTRGTVFSDLRPDDHVWHRALWFSWKFINGVNYWEENRETQQSDGWTRMRTVDRVVSPERVVTLSLALDYGPGQAADSLLKEARTVVIHPPDESGAYRLDWSSTFTAVETVVLDRTPLPGQPNGQGWGGYAGYSLRLSQDVLGGIFANSEGLSGAAANRKRARWMSYSVPNQGSVLILDHPENFNYPSTWYHVQDMPYFSPAVIHDGPHTLQAGASLTLTYRVVVHPDALAPAAAEREWKQWTERTSTP